MRHHTDSTLESAPLTTHEHVRFPNGDHVIVHTSPGGVQVTGMLGGEYVEYAGTARDAQEQARLLETDAPDALWTLPEGQARRIAAAMDGAAGIAAVEGVPWAGSSEDVDESGEDPAPERVALDGGHVDVDVIDQHVETTVTIKGRITLGIALTATEAARLGEALTGAARAAYTVQAAQIDLESVETVTDLWHRSRETGVPMAALLEGMGR